MIALICSYKTFRDFAVRTEGTVNLERGTIKVGPLEFVWVDLQDTNRLISLELKGVMFIDDHTWARLSIEKIAGIMRRVR